MGLCEAKSMAAKSMQRRKTVYFMAVRRQVLNKKHVKEKYPSKAQYIASSNLTIMLLN